jgi:hypothetical protein
MYHSIPGIHVSIEGSIKLSLASTEEFVRARALIFFYTGLESTRSVEVVSAAAAWSSFGGAGGTFPCRLNTWNRLATSLG